MIRKLLIANRGEIACRVAETARHMGVTTVAVFSDVDSNARHLALCDEAVPLGGKSPAESYLRGEAIIEAALCTGADAIHPGYGFLSENPDFVEAVEAAGLIFVGPSAKAIRAMGLKDAAKALMEKAGVPVVPGYHGADQSLEGLQREAEAIGYPVLIKAVAGGGGKGMRLVEDARGFADALSSAQGEAQTAFGNADVLIEKFVSHPRHIEIQVFGDGKKAVHLFERDCSLQRRHQKVIEEAPAPGMTQEMRQAMGDAAVKAAEAIGYKGAGTVEFIVDGSDGLKTDRFWFMEMNTRLQVEHPVSEEITGVDLVEWQLRVAGGEALPCTQEDLTIHGHAFEARLYAEDVPAGFLPATGRLSHLTFPKDARIDTGVRTGDVISPWYDPMIAKVTVHGATRREALGKLERALKQTEVAGLVTNLAFLQALTRHEGFGEGAVDTGLIARDIEALTQTPKPCSKTQALAALEALELTQSNASGFALWAPLEWTVDLKQGDAVSTLRVKVLDQGLFDVAGPEGAHRVELSGGAFRIDGVKTQARTHLSGNEIAVFFGNTYVLHRIDLLDRVGDKDTSGAILAPMPGLVKAVLIKVGDVVEEGAKLAVLEAMKMEHALVAAQTGTIAEIAVSEGDQVEAGALLIQLETQA